MIEQKFFFSQLEKIVKPNSFNIKIPSANNNNIP